MLTLFELVHEKPVEIVEPFFVGKKMEGFVWLSTVVVLTVGFIPLTELTFAQPKR